MMMMKVTLFALVGVVSAANDASYNFVRTTPSRRFGDRRLVRSGRAISIKPFVSPTGDQTLDVDTYVTVRKIYGDKVDVKEEMTLVEHKGVPQSTLIPLGKFEIYFTSENKQRYDLSITKHPKEMESAFAKSICDLYYDLKWAKKQKYIESATKTVYKGAAKRIVFEEKVYKETDSSDSLEIDTTKTTFRANSDIFKNLYKEHCKDPTGENNFFNHIAMELKNILQGLPKPYNKYGGINKYKKSDFANAVIASVVARLNLPRRHCKILSKDIEDNAPITWVPEVKADAKLAKDTSVKAGPQNFQHLTGFF